MSYIQRLIESKEDSKVAIDVQEPEPGRRVCEVGLSREGRHCLEKLPGAEHASGDEDNETGASEDGVLGLSAAASLQPLE